MPERWARLRGHWVAGGDTSRSRVVRVRLRGRKRKGTAEIQLPSGEIVRAELHWYEATGIGRREFKIKRLP